DRTGSAVEFRQNHSDQITFSRPPLQAESHLQNAIIRQERFPKMPSYHPYMMSTMMEIPHEPTNMENITLAELSQHQEDCQTYSDPELPPPAQAVSSSY